MKTRVLYFTMIAAALSFSCQKEIDMPGENSGEINEVVDFVPGPGRILAVTPKSDTKVAFGDANEDGSIPVVWVDKDAIKVYSENNTTGAQYTFEGESASSAVFNGDPVEGATRYAVYPAGRAKEMKEGKVGVSFASLQSSQLFHSTLKNNSNNLKHMPMWAKETGEGVFEFQNLCGAVAFRFNDYQELRGMKIANVTITSKSKAISGWGYVDPETGELTLDTSTDPKRYTISVNNDKSTGPYDIANTKNKSINDEGKTGFIMALPAGTYPPKDLTVTITDNFGRVFEQVVSSELVIKPGELRHFPTLSFTFSYGKSNCIVVKKGETISFDAAPYYSFSKSLSVDSMKPVMKRVNSDEGGEDVESGEDVEDVEGGEDVEAVEAGEDLETVESFCEEGTTLERVWGIRNNYAKPTVTSVLPDGSFTKDGNTITITGGSNVGNALLALKAADGTILWSWHIWVVDGENAPTDQAYTACEGQPTFMDRNLGATTNEYGNRYAVGLYYQYGRKDPFVIRTDEVTITSSGDYYTSDMEITDVEVRNSGNSNMAWTIKNPNKRIVYTATASGNPPKGFLNWLNPAEEIENNWGSPGKVTSVAECNASMGGYKTIYDPCPAGYRVPDYYYFTGLTAENGKGVSGKGVKFTVAEGVEAVYPLPGTLSVGTYGDTNGKGAFRYNYSGFYWTTALTNDSAIGFLYSSSTFHTNTLGSRTCVRPAAANIRCMKIE